MRLRLLLVLPLVSLVKTSRYRGYVTTSAQLFEESESYIRQILMKPSQPNACFG